ncbi:MAG: DUF6285 domain-containing protein [Myxococcota bacterium]
MGERPTKTELIEAVSRFLEQELLPDLEGVQRFHARVALNALSIVRREIDLERPNLLAQLSRLRALLERDEACPEDPAELDGVVDGMEAELCTRIREGEADEPAFRARLLEHLRETTRERLAVANPRYR